MSLPLTRRIARAALLVAAGAAPLVGAAGTAHAAELARTPKPTGGLTNLDVHKLGNNVDGAMGKVGKKAGTSSDKAMKASLPKAGKTVGGLGKSALPTAQRTTGRAAQTSGSLLGQTARSAAKNGLGEAPAQVMPFQGGGVSLSDV